MAESEGTTRVRQMVREAVSNAYYEARNEGETMEAAADRATDSVMRIIESVDANARAWGEGKGALDMMEGQIEILRGHGSDVSGMEQSVALLRHRLGL